MQSQPTLYRRHIVARELGIELPERFHLDPSPWHVVVSSRLGKNLLKRRCEIAWMRYETEKANARGDRSLIVSDTAASPWSDRACELLGFDPIRLTTDNAPEPWQRIALPPNVCRDQLSLALADRIDAAYVRPGGTIFQRLQQRIAQDSSPTVQVLLTPHDNEASKQLITAGAIGYWLGQPASDETSRRVGSRHECPPSHWLSASSSTAQLLTASLTAHPERWLIHSTRERTGPWPGQSRAQFNDWLLLSPPVPVLPTPLETLKRIVHEQRLVGSHRTTKSTDPVVCFTSLPIDQWLRRRKFRSHLGRWDCEPYGIAVNREAATRHGFAPVIYGDSGEITKVGEAERWRFQATGATFDWTEEQEWRARGIVDLKKFKADEVVVFVNRTDEAASIIAESPWPVLSVQGAGLITSSSR